MTIAQIKAKLPEAEVYTIDDEKTYAIIFDYNKVPLKIAREFAQGCGIAAYLVGVDGNPQEAIAIIELEKD